MNDYFVVAQNELKCFQQHSLARTYKQYTPGYYLHYEEFRNHKAKRDLALFNIDFEVTTIASYWFLKASIEHDLAEDNEHDILLANRYWDSCNKYLIMYYCIIYYYFYNNLKERVPITTLLQADTVEAITNKLKMTKFIDLDRIKSLGKSEMLVWKYHHLRKYDLFVEHNKLILNGFGIDDVIAFKASEFLALASKKHDLAESIEARITSNTDSIWTEAYNYLVQYHKLVLKGMHGQTQD